MMDGSFSMTSDLVQEQVMAEQRKMLIIIIMTKRTARTIHRIHSQGGYHSHSVRPGGVGWKGEGEAFKEDWSLEG